MAKSQAYKQGFSKPSNMGKTLLVDNVNEERILSQKVVQLELSKKKLSSTIIQQKFKFLNQMDIKQEKWLKDHAAQVFQINNVKKKATGGKKLKKKKRKVKRGVKTGQTAQPKNKNGHKKGGKSKYKHGSEYNDNDLDSMFDNSFKRHKKGKPLVGESNKFLVSQSHQLQNVKRINLPPIEENQKATIKLNMEERQNDLSNSTEIKMPESFPQIDIKKVAILDQYSKKIIHRKPRKLSPVTANPLLDERFKDLRISLQPLKPVVVEDFGSLMTTMNMARRHLFKFRARKRKAKQFKTDVNDDFETLLETKESAIKEENELSDSETDSEAEQ